MCLKHTRLGRALGICACPPPLSYDDIPANPVRLSPIDHLGFPTRCCGCIPLRPATFIICIISFLWATYELYTVDKYMATIFPEQNKTYYYFKLFYTMWSICFVLVSGVLMFGIIIKYHIVNVYVWFACLYLCVAFTTTVVGVILRLVKTGSVVKKQITGFVFSVIWSCLFLYFLMIVNSYKMTLW